MKRFLVGADRGQSTLLPECLDEWIDESNPVRAVDAFVDALDLGKLVGGTLQHRQHLSLATFTSRTILPASSTMQMLVSLTETSSPAKWSMLRFSF